MPPDHVGRAIGADPGPSPDAYEAVLAPNRSLPNGGFRVVMAVVIVANLFTGYYFWRIGAWPVIGFCGLDALAVFIAFKLSYRQGRLRERVRLTPESMLVTRVLPSGHESRWVLQPFWTRVVIARAGRHDASVELLSKGRRLILGSFLSPDERVSFGQALAGALAASRSSAATPG